MSFPNVYAHRKVAETAMRGCDVCFRPTSSVLLSEGADAKDFFFVCPSHLKDSKFCSPVVDEGAAEAKRKREMEEEVERVRKEYEERKKKKEEEEKEKEDDKKDKDDEKKDEKEKEKGKDDKAKEEGDKKKESSPATPTPDEEPRVFALQRIFFNQRLSKKREAEVAKREAEMSKRNRERLQKPDLFPSVPKNLPGT